MERQKDQDVEYGKEVFLVRHIFWTEPHPKAFQAVWNAPEVWKYLNEYGSTREEAIEKMKKAIDNYFQHAKN